MDDLAKETKRVADTLESLVTISGKMSQSLTALNILKGLGMEKEKEIQEVNHEAIIALHSEFFQQIRDNIKILVQNDKDRNGRWDKHVEESFSKRALVDQNCRDIETIKTGHKEIRAWAAGIVLAIVGLIFWTGYKMSNIDRLILAHDAKSGAEIIHR